MKHKSSASLVLSMPMTEAVEAIYRDFHLIGHSFSDQNNNNSCYRVHAHRELGSGKSESFNEKVCFTEEYVLFNLRRQNPFPILEAKVFARAKARIDTQLFEDGKSYNDVILTTTPPPEPKPDHAVQRYVLVALSRLRRSSPASFKLEAIEANGLCDLIGTTKEQYLYNAGLLLEKGYIKEGDVDQLTIENGGMYITAEGIDYLELVKKMGSEDFETKGDAEKGKEIFEYDLVISYASEDGTQIDDIAKAVRKKGFNVFYDKFEEVKVKLWGTNLYDYLADIYSRRGRYCMIVISEKYAEKVWTNHERQNAQARALHEKEGYILPLRVDNTELPGLPSTVGYLDLRKNSQDEIVNIVVAKLTSH
ncbi:TIR domain-containing protein [Candidatus Kaiserbacteria bacterium]|nr:TIR domain-containing protein [Candidatus Kaiserbacteria bacterium]